MKSYVRGDFAWTLGASRNMLLAINNSVEDISLSCESVSDGAERGVECLCVISTSHVPNLYLGLQRTSLDP